MAKGPESRVKAAVVKILRAHSVYYFFPATGGFGRSGVPDIVCCVNGRFLGIECKAGGNTVTALQAQELEKIRMSGGAAMVVNEENLDMLEPAIRALKAREPVR